MSHDRGCYCGKEPYEYAECTRMDCTKGENSRSYPMKTLDIETSAAPVTDVEAIRKEAEQVAIPHQSFAALCAIYVETLVKVLEKAEKERRNQSAIERLIHAKMALNHLKEVTK